MDAPFGCIHYLSSIRFDLYCDQPYDARHPIGVMLRLPKFNVSFAENANNSRNAFLLFRTSKNRFTVGCTRTVDYDESRTKPMDTQPP